MRALLAADRFVQHFDLDQVGETALAPLQM